MTTGGLELVLAALLGSLPSLIALLRERRMGKAEREKLKAESFVHKADAADKLTDVAVQLVEPLQALVARLEDKSERQSEELTLLKRKSEDSARVTQILLRGLVVLQNQLQGLGVTPVFIVPVYNHEGEYLVRLLSDEIDQGIK